MYGDYLYINNVMQKAYNIVKYDGHTYFVYDGHKIAKNCRLYLTEKFASAAGVPVGYYEFNDQGHLIVE